MILYYIFFILFVTIFLLLVTKAEEIKQLHFISLIGSAFVLVLSTIIVINFDFENYYFQEQIWLDFGTSFNLTYSFGLDGISLFFFYLSSLLVFLCILYLWNEKMYKEYVLTLFTIKLFLLVIFSVLDLFLFYIFFEAILIPMYIVIGVWGSRARKIRAAYLFFFYTLCGSILMLIGILYIYKLTGTLNYEYLVHFKFSLIEQKLLWLAFFLSFASKIPMFPFHIWLPEAHVEAPTVGSVLLAGILLKLGVYGFLRFSLSLFPDASLYFSPIVYLLCVIGVLYTSSSAIRQTDLKRIIAYSSVAHMNMVTLGIFSFNIIGIEGSILQSISHGFVSGGLFFIIGIIYSRYHTRFLQYYGGLTHVMPFFSIVFLVFTMANIALPGTSSFIGEFLLLSGIYKSSFCCCFASALGVILSGAYSLWLFNRIMFGNLKIDYTLKFKDISLLETSILFPLFFFIFAIGLYPSLILDPIHFSSTILFFHCFPH